MAYGYFMPTTAAPTSTTYTAEALAEAYSLRMDENASWASIADHLGRGDWVTARVAVVDYARQNGLPVPPVPVRNRRFGVEIECLLSFTEAAAALVDAGVASSGWVGYTHAVGSEWKVVSDASVYRGCEVVSPPLRGKAGIREVKKVMKALRARGARVNVACGMHVHMEADDLDGESLERLVRNYATLQSSVNSLLPRSRRNGSFSQDFTAADGDYVGTLLRTRKNDVRNGRTSPSIDRYKSVNVHSFPLYGTIEFRQHQGTLNGTKMESWVTMLTAMIGAAVNGFVSQPGDDVIDLVAAYGTPEAADYLSRRREALA